MFTNRDIMQIAMKQSAIDINCDMDDFKKYENVIVTSNICSQARKYYEEPIACNLVSYGCNIVASVKNEYKSIVREYIGKFEFFRCFETPNILWLDNKMSELGQRVCFMAEYFLPDMQKIQPLSCNYEMRVLEQKDFADLYLPQWSNALCEKRKELDILGMGAYDSGRLVGFAACSEDCSNMWQIGVDVLPEYRRKGIACALTANLAMEILNRNKVPFYCCAWSNIPSARNAIRCGFSPAWVELTVKPEEFVKNMMC